MSEKLYFITAKTKGKNPMVLFLNGNIAWSKYAMANPLLEHLHRCQAWAEAEPTHCFFVEAKDSLRQELKDIMNSEKDFVTPAKLKQLIEKYDCHTVSTKQKKSKPAKEEPREYVLYYTSPYATGHTYYSCGGGETSDRHQARLMTLSEANDKAKEFADKGEYQWLHTKCRAQTRPLKTMQDAAAEQPQKRVGYVVFYSDVDGNKEYKTRNWGNPTEVFRTPKDAQFAADVLDSDIDTERGWKVEQIEF